MMPLTNFVPKSARNRADSALVFRLSIGLAAVLAACSMAGCSGDFGAVSPAAAFTGAAFQGNVHGGQQPLTGAHIYLYAAGTTGYASASTSLLDKTKAAVSTDTNGNGYVLSGAGGNFSITGGWHCQQATDQVYLLITGGNPGLAQGTNNTAISMMGALGTCSSLSASTFVVVNELSTIAAATALQQFMADATHVGATASNAAGIANAFSTAIGMVPIQDPIANAVTAGGNGTVPQSTLHTLANILSACINTASGASTQCSGLFSAAKPPTAAAPADTLAAALDIAQNPTNNVGTLFALSPGTPPFQPSLPSAPSDWSIGITYTISGNVLAEPAYLAIDGTGNVWVTNRASEKPPYSTPDSVVKLSPFGAVLSGAGGYTDGGLINLPEGMAIDDVGNVWIASDFENIHRITSTGADTPGFPFSGGYYPQGIAIDKNGNAWISNYGNGGGTDVMLVSKTGTFLKDSVSSTNFAGPQGVAIDSTGNIWVAGQPSSSVLKISGADYSVLSGSGSGFTAGGLNHPAGVAIDASNQAWISNTYDGNGTATFSLLANNGTPVSTTGYLTTTAAGYQNLVAIDGANSAWTAICSSRCVNPPTPDAVAHVTQSGAVVNLRTPGLSVPQGVGIDGSGNVWIANTGGQYTTTNGTVLEIIGAGAPTKTPVQAALKGDVNGSLLGKRP